MEQWLATWIRNRYQWQEHVPLPTYMLLSEFIEALKDYEKYRSDELQKLQMQDKQAGV